MKSIIIALLVASPVAAQSNRPVTVKGTLAIQYNSRSAAGRPDVYTMDLNYSDSAVFRGSITNTPIIVGTFGVTQPASLNYRLECDVVNPANPTQRRNIGRLYGDVPISQDGVYDFTAGRLKVAIEQMGRAQGFESAYGGTAAGKPIYKPRGFLETLKKETQNLTKSLNGKTVSIAVKNYDQMAFNGHKIASGPVQVYGEATVNGRMLYDYDRFAWHFQDVSINYAMDGTLKVDRVSGSIRWIERPKSGASREGEYQFDVRVNEPSGEAWAGAGAVSESSFFETDDSIASLTGTMKYRDSLTGNKVMASSVVIDLTGNKLSRQQGMNLTKLILISAIVPMNAE